MRLFCQRGHVLARFVIEVCEGGHDHRIYECYARVGRGACAHRLVEPPFGPSCTEEEKK